MENENNESRNLNKRFKRRSTALIISSIILSLFWVDSSLAQSGSSTGGSDTNKSTTQSSNENNKVAPPMENQTPAAESDKLDVEGLEKKYWSAKDDDFTVVQNRTFTKNKKFYFSFMTGKIVNDGFIEGAPNSISLGYFFNEKNGLNIDYTNYITKNNSVTNQFISQNGANPSYNTILNTTSLRYFWSPIYAKVSLLEKKILYLDFALGVHVGQTGYKIMTQAGGEIKKATHYGFDISQLWFLNKNFAVRFDIRNTWTNQTQKTYYNQGGGGSTDLGTTRFQDNAWLLGINIFFGKK